MDYNTLLDRARNIVFRLEDRSIKGEGGRIGIFGGSRENSGAPCFCGIAALRTGADMVSIICSAGAADSIKACEPDLVVDGVLHHCMEDSVFKNLVNKVDVLVIGPGLEGFITCVAENIKLTIKNSGKLSKPLPIIIDGAGIELLMEKKNVFQNYPGPVIVTPNTAEFEKLFGTNRANIREAVLAYGPNITVLEKGACDMIYYNLRTSPTRFVCPTGGSNRRCANQGNLITGALATFMCWAQKARDPDPELIACFAASQMIKRCNQLAFEAKGRSMICKDMVKLIHICFEEFFESEQSKGAPMLSEATKA